MTEGMDLSAVPRELLFAVLALVTTLAVVQGLAVAWRRAARRRRIHARIVRAGLGETRAAGWLADLGYEVLGAQVSAEYPLRVDDALYTAHVRADYLVRRAGLRYVVEVKTGGVAPRIETSAPRRQLLEYRLAFAVDGVLLVDAEQARVRLVEFPLPAGTRGSRARPSWELLLVGVVGVVIGAALLASVALAVR
jgi:hypothetical protein